MTHARILLLLATLLSTQALGQDFPLSSPAPDAGDGLDRFLSRATTPAGEELLDPEEAFIASVDMTDHNTLVARWNIADGYYLYQQRFGFTVDHPAVQLGEPRFPPGQWQEDEFFGEVETYRHGVAITIPITWNENQQPPATLELRTISQGCADVGVCYPPRQETIPVILSSTDSAASP